MPDTDSLLHRWRKAGILDAEAEARIRAYEAGQSAPGAGRLPDLAGLGWQGTIALVLGAILLACGVALFVSAHWDAFAPLARYAVVIAMVAVFHLAGGLVRPRFLALSTALHAVGTVAAGAAIALVGQIFNIQEHWPAAILLWAIAAAAGWLLLRDQAQQALTLLLIPAWILCELHFQMTGHIGDGVFLGRILFAWAIFYLTFFLGSSRHIVQGILFAASAVAAVIGTAYMLGGWTSWSSTQSFVSFGSCVWAWTAIAGVPLVVAAFHGHKGLIPIALATVYVIALPWCQHTGIKYTGAQPRAFTEPNLAAYALVALFAIFLCIWGVRVVSKALVNLGVAGFAIAVAWFYFSSVYSKVGRSLGLIGLGILFLAGGWALEKARRRLMARVQSSPEAQ